MCSNKRWDFVENFVENPRTKARRKYARCRTLQEEVYAQRVARTAIRKRGEWPTRQAKHDARRREKWQCTLTKEESAELDVIRMGLFKGCSRYNFVRRFLLYAIEEGRETFIERETLKYECGIE